MSEADPKTSLGESARSGARTSLIAQVAVQVGSAAATVILARILAPSEFGVIALAQSLLGAATLVGLGGITAAIVTSTQDVRTKASTYFWLALVVGTALALILTAASPTVVAALGQPDAAGYVVILSLTLPLSLLALVPQALLQRRLHFGRMNAVIVIGAVVYFVMEISLAVAGWGAWAVIWGQVGGAAASLVTGLVLASWLPTARPRLAEIKGDLALISNLGLGSFLIYLSKNADYWAVSRTLGAGTLGVYYIAYVLPSIVRMRLSEVFRQVMLPIMARLPDEAARNAAWSRALGVTLSLAFPALFGLAAISEPLTTVLFGSDWSAAVVPMQLITLAAVTDVAFYAVSTMTIARRRHVFRMNILVAIRALMIGIGALVAGVISSSLTVVAAAVLGASLVSLGVQEVTVARPLGVGVTTLGGGPWRLMVASALMAIGVQTAVMSVLAPLPPLAQIPIAILFGVVLYAGIAVVIARKDFRDSLQQAARLAGLGRKAAS